MQKSKGNRTEGKKFLKEIEIEKDFSSTGYKTD